MSTTRHIDCSSKEKIQTWCSRFNCEEIDLIDAIKKIGTNASTVKLMLELNRKIKPRNTYTANDRP